MLESLKSKLGFKTDDGYDDEFYDDYDAYADNFDDYSTDDDDQYGYDRGSVGTRDAGGYSAYAPVTTRTAGTNRRAASSYTDRAASRYSSSHPPLVNMQDVRASSQDAEYPVSTQRRRTSLGRNSVGRASDYALSGAEVEKPEPQAAAEEAAEERAASSSARHDSVPTRAASAAPARHAQTPAQAAAAEAKKSSETPAVQTPRTRKVVVLTPQTYGEVESVARTLKAGDAVILSLGQTDAELAKRVLDFSFGVASALEGSVDVVADKVFAITRSVPLTDAEMMRLKSQGVLR